MKTIAQVMITALATLTFCLGSAWAGEVTGLTTFVPDTPAVAGQVNDNFTAVKTAVDDNYARTISNDTDIANTTNALTAAVNQINANTALIAGMPGISGVEGDPPHVTQTPRILLDQTITAPTNGYVLAIFGGIVYFQSHTAGTYQRMRMWLNLDGSGNFYGQSFRFFEVRGDWATGQYYQNASSFTIIPVAAGDTTVYAVGDSSEPDGASNTVFYNCNLYLLFIPNFY